MLDEREMLKRFRTALEIAPSEQGPHDILTLYFSRIAAHIDRVLYDGQAKTEVMSNLETACDLAHKALTQIPFKEWS
jgi:hypothetical protein